MTTLSLLNRRDPFGDFDALVRQAFGPNAVSRGFSPAAEIARDGDDALVRIELPGVDVENDVTVEIADGRLVVRGERRDERAEERAGRSLREISYGEFRRMFTLPKHVDTEAVSASYDAGVLNVRVSGAYANKEARRITITPEAAKAPEVEAPVEDAGA